MTFTSDLQLGIGTFRAMASALTAIGAVGPARRAVRDFAGLSALSDAELEAGGLSRETLSETVMARHLRSAPPDRTTDC